MKVIAVADDSDPSYMRYGKVVRAVAENQMELTFLLLIHKEGADTSDLKKKIKMVSRESGLEAGVEVVETAGVINPAFPIAKKAKELQAVAIFVPEEMTDITAGLKEQLRDTVAIEPISGAYPVSEIMASPPISVTPEFTAQEAAAAMKQRNIMSLVVMREGSPQGALTMGNLMKIVQGGQSSREVRVSEIMSAPLFTIDVSEAADTAARIMAEKGVRILGVNEDGVLKGVITATDLLKLPPKKKEKMDEHLRKIIRLC